jgi:hypothetical protein
MVLAKRAVFVGGRSYPVQEKQGYLKADLGGLFGWTSVWAETYTQLVRRIKWVLTAGER